MPRMYVSLNKLYWSPDWNGQPLSSVLQGLSLGLCVWTPLLINTVLEALASAVWQEMKILNIQIGTEEAKLPYSQETWSYIQKNPNESTKKKPSRISEFIKFTRQKINIQKSTLFLYTSNEQYKNETKKQLHLHSIKIRNKFNKSRARWLYWKIYSIVKIVNNI